MNDQTAWVPGEVDEVKERRAPRVAKDELAQRVPEVLAQRVPENVPQRVAEGDVAWEREMHMV